jgi:anti-sigma factor RsiW
MTDRDLELIVDLLDNRLSQADAEAALSRINSDPELAAEYEQQVAVKAALTDEAVVAMSSEERSTLRESLITQLNLEEAPVAAPIRTTKRSWWAPVLGLGAAAVVVVAIVVIPGTFGSSSDSAEETVALSQITVAAATPETAEAPTDNGTDTGGEADAAADGLTRSVSVPELEGEDVPDVLTATAGAKTPQEVTEDVSTLGYQQSLNVDREQIDACLAELKAKLPPETTGAIVLGAEETDTSLIVHLGLTFADGIQAGVSVDLADCSVVTFDR